MTAWYNEFIRLVSDAIWSYGGLTQAFVIIALAAFAFAALINWTGHALRIPVPSKGAVTVLLVSLAAFLAALAAFNVFVAPRTYGLEWSMNAKLMLTVLVLLLVTVPLICRMQEASYPAAAASAVFSSAGTVLAVLLIGALVDVVFDGATSGRGISFSASTLSDFFLAE